MRRLFRPRPGPDRDSRRQYVVLGLAAAGFVAVGVVAGALDDDPAVVLLDATPAATAEATPAPPAGTPAVDVR